jgi:hypothetical protein
MVGAVSFCYQSEIWRGINATADENDGLTPWRILVQSVKSRFIPDDRADHVGINSWAKN